MFDNTIQESLTNQLIGINKSIHCCFIGTIISWNNIEKKFLVKIKSKFQKNTKNYSDDILCTAYSQTCFKDTLTIGDDVIILFTDYNQDNPSTPIEIDNITKHHKNNGIIITKIIPFDSNNNDKITITTNRDDIIIKNKDKSTINITEGIEAKSSKNGTINITDGIEIKSSQNSTIETTTGITAKSSTGSTLNITAGIEAKSSTGSTLNITAGIEAKSMTGGEITIEELISIKNSTSSLKQVLESIVNLFNASKFTIAPSPDNPSVFMITSSDWLPKVQAEISKLLK